MSLTVGSTYKFQATVVKDGQPWAIESAALVFAGPKSTFTVTPAVAGNVATYLSSPSDLSVPGNWRRRWIVTDAGGTVIDNAPWIGFRVDP